MSVLSDIGSALVQGVTGTSVSDIQAQAQAAEQQLTIAISTMIALQAIMAIELLLLMAMAWKERH